MILEANAVSIGSLKKISAKQLALVSQSLSLFLICIPAIRNILSQSLPIQQHVLLLELDRIAAAYEEHRNNINNKFITMMEDIVNRLCKDIQYIEWNKIATNPNGSDFINSIILNMKTLYKQLIQLLPDSQMAVYIYIYINVIVDI